MSIKKDILKELKTKGYSNKQVKEYFSLIKHIYIGQNIRNEGILYSDEIFKKNKEIIENLEKDGIVTSQKYYKLKVVNLSNLGIQISEILLAETIKEKGEDIKKELEKYPPLLIGFLVNHYLSTSLAYDMEKSLLFNWKDLILNNDKVRNWVTKFFDFLKRNGLSVVTNDYVSTGGGEKRGKRIVISSETRRLLQSMYSIGGLNSEDIIKCKVAYLLIEEIKYKEKGENCYISEDELRKTGNFDYAYKIVKEELEAFQKSGLIKNLTFSLAGNVNFFIVNKNELNREINFLYREKITKLIGMESLFDDVIPKISTPEEKIENNTLIISDLIENKVRLYRLISQLSHGKGIFNSNPNTELFALNLIDPIYDENELKEFIINLHQLIIESSANKILRFVDNKDFWESKGSKNEENNDISPKEFKEIVEEADEGKLKLYEDAKEILNDIHNLRNHYSHLQDSKKLYESSLIFKKLINISFPITEDEFSETQGVLLDKSREALEKLCDVLINVIRKRKDSEL